MWVIGMRAGEKAWSWVLGVAGSESEGLGLVRRVVGDTFSWSVQGVILPCLWVVDVATWSEKREELDRWMLYQ